MNEVIKAMLSGYFAGVIVGAFISFMCGLAVRELRNGR